MTRSHQSGRIGKTTQRRLIRRLAQADLDPVKLAEELGLSLQQLAAWAAKPENLSLLETLARLAEIRAQLLLSNFRANAAVHLIQIAMSNSEGDSARKACVDLLQAKLDAFLPPQVPAPPLDADDFNSLSDDAILEAMEQLGRRQGA